MFKSCAVVMAAVLLVACSAPKPRERTPPDAAPPAGGETGAAGRPEAGAGAGGGAGAAGGAGTVAAAASAVDAMTPPAGPGVYAIDPRSEIRLLVYRAGAMARLGHNHVITHHSVGGWIKFTGDPMAASFALSLPVADFVVDDPGARTEEGMDFIEEVTQDAKEGTRRNMLSEALLDAGHYQMITLTSVSVTGKAGAMIATMRLSIAGHESTLVVPFEVTIATGHISASGITTLRQTALGLKPFSVMLGALQVQDELTVKFTLFAG